MKRTFFIISALLLFTALLSACASGSPAPPDAPPIPTMAATAAPTMGAAPPSDGDEGFNSYDPELGESPSEGAPEIPMVVDPSRKLIRYGTLEIESTAFDQSLNLLYSIIGAEGGFLDNSTVVGISKAMSAGLRSATFTARIPSGRFDAFLGRAGEIGNVLVRRTSSDDVTDQYFDTEAHLETLGLERSMLMEELDNTGKMADRIILLERITNVQYEIERLTGLLKKYDALVNYSTITITISEVLEITEETPAVTPPKTLGERVSASFRESLKVLKTIGENFLIWLVGIIPFLPIWGVIIFIITFACIRYGKRQSAKSPPPPPSDGDTAS